MAADATATAGRFALRTRTPLGTTSASDSSANVKQFQTPEHLSRPKTPGLLSPSHRSNVFNLNSDTRQFGSTDAGRSVSSSAAVTSGRSSLPHSRPGFGHKQQQQHHPCDTPSTVKPRVATVSFAAIPTVIMDPEAELQVGDVVEVPGGMTGTVKYVGGVAGKKGVFAGVELSKEFASRGKNDGDVDGQRYFDTSVPGSGIFLPAHRATRQDAPASPATPSTPGIAHPSHLRHSGRPSNSSPQTPSLPRFSQSAGPGSKPPQFSQSVGAGARAPSPQFKPKRPSLPRPESPLRKQPSLPSTQTPSGRTSATGFDSGIQQPRKSTGMAQTPHRQSIGAKTPGRKLPEPKTPSASQSRSSSRLGESSPPEEDPTPVARTRLSKPGLTRPGSNSSVGQQAQADRAMSSENTRLQRSLEERDKQLKEQAASLAEMESSLAELQSLMGAANIGGMGGKSGGAKDSPSGSMTNGTPDDPTIADADTRQLRAMLREKNEKIALLTAEFDAHRADFRSTIDTLEMASTETERVYEKRVDELLAEIADRNARKDLPDRNSQQQASEVEGFAKQLRQLEEVVAELEEGLEDARRGEAEAKGEVEFLRGEVERTRTELKREREKAAKALQGAGAAMDERSNSTGGNASSSREVEQRDDEIRGLKAIIHSLSSGGTEAPSSPAVNASNQLGGSDREELTRLRSSIDNLTRERGELQGLIERKSYREEELERELAASRGNGSRPVSKGLGHRNHSASITSTKTAIRPGSTHDHKNNGQMRPNSYESAASSRDRPNTSSSSIGGGAEFHDANENSTIATSPPRVSGHDKFDSASNAHTDFTDDEDPDSPCGICGKLGHSMLNCDEVGGSGSTTIDRNRNGNGVGATAAKAPPPAPSQDTPPAPAGKVANFKAHHAAHPSAVVAPLSLGNSNSPPGSATQPTTNTEPASSALDLKTLPPDAPAPGKSSGKIDASAWCALCEREGHSSIDCPFEGDF